MIIFIYIINYFYYIVFDIYLCFIDLTDIRYNNSRFLELFMKEITLNINIRIKDFLGLC